MATQANNEPKPEGISADAKAPVAEPENEVKSVEYTGDFVRQITREEWAQAGVANQETVVWDASNGRKIPVERFNSAALAKLREVGGFSVPE